MPRKVQTDATPPQGDEPSVDDVVKLLLSWTSLSMKLSRGRNFSRNLRGISELGLTLPMMVTLHMIAFEGRQTMTTLVEHLALSTSATSHLIQRLVEIGLVERKDDAIDRRQKQLALTREGQALVAEMMRSRFDELRDSIAPLSPTTRQALHAVMCDVVAELSTHAHAVHAARVADTATARSMVDDIANDIADAAAEAGDAIADSAAHVGDVIADGAARVGDAIADKVAEKFDRVFTAGMKRVAARVNRTTSERNKRDRS